MSALKIQKRGVKKELKPNSSYKLPSKVYKSCPSCKSKELIKLECDVLCSRCDWISAEAYVLAGGMDNTLRSISEHLHGSKSLRTLQNS